VKSCRESRDLGLMIDWISRVAWLGMDGNCCFTGVRRLCWMRAAWSGTIASPPFHLRWERVDVVLNDFTLVVQIVCTWIQIHDTSDYWNT
jgi:hypothetical protein